MSQTDEHEDHLKFRSYMPLAEQSKRTSLGKVNKVTVNFDLPFVLLVADTFANGEKEHAFITQGAAFTAPSSLGPVNLWFRKLPANTLKMGDTSIELEACEYQGSSSRNMGHTEVIAEFTVLSDDIPIGCIGEKFDNKQVNMSRAVIEAVNAFLRHYRISSLKYYIPRATVYTVALFVIYEHFESGLIQPIITVRYYENPTPFNQTLGEEEENKIRIALQHDHRNYIHELFAEVWNKKNLEEWRLVVFESAVLLEAWITPFLKESYAAKGLTKTAIKEKFKTGEMHYPMGISEICEKLVEDATGFAFQHTEEYKVLVEHVIRLRNKVIHGTQLVVTEEEAVKCLWGVIHAVGLINAMPIIQAIATAAPIGLVHFPEIQHPFPDVTRVEALGRLAWPAQTVNKLAL